MKVRRKERLGRGNGVEPDEDDKASTLNLKKGVSSSAYTHTHAIYKRIEARALVSSALFTPPPPHLQGRLHGSQGGPRVVNPHVLHGLLVGLGYRLLQRANQNLLPLVHR